MGPLAGFMMGAESQNYLQTNDTQAANQSIQLNDQDLSKHNSTVKGAIVKFAKHTHLMEKKEEKKEEKKVEDKHEEKKEDKKEVKKEEVKKEEKKEEKKPEQKKEEKKS